MATYASQPNPKKNASPAEKPICSERPSLHHAGGGALLELWCASSVSPVVVSQALLPRCRNQKQQEEERKLSFSGPALRRVHLLGEPSEANGRG